MKNIIKSILLIILLVISTSCKSTSNKELNYDNFDLAIMIEDGDNKYKDYDGTNWPDENDYALNVSVSTCNDGSSIEWDDEKGMAYLTSDNWDKCTVKFDKIIKIEKIEDLVDLSIRVNAGDSLKGKTVRLMKDLDFQKTEDYRESSSTKYADFNDDGIKNQTIYQELTNEDGAGFMPIGGNKTNFEGTFDGNDCKLSNIYINNYKNTSGATLGLFGVIKNSTIKNLTTSGNIKTNITSDIGGIAAGGTNFIIDNCINETTFNSSSGNAYSVGGLIGSAGGDSIVKNSINKANISLNGGNAFGGLVGCINSSGQSLLIQNSHNEGNITSTESDCMGGLIGRDNSTKPSTLTIKDSYNNGEVTLQLLTSKKPNVGGLVGQINKQVSIFNSYNSREIKIDMKIETLFSVGGLIGNVSGKAEINESYNQNNITNLHNNYSASQQLYMGGLIGVLQNNGTVKIKSCNNSGIIKDATKIGGLVGMITGKCKLFIDKSFNIADLQMNISYSGDGVLDLEAGGLVGYAFESNVYILNSYNIGNLNCTANSPAGLLGYNFQGTTSNIYNSYNAGDSVNGISSVTGTNENTITINNVFNIGNALGNGISSLDKTKTTVNIKNAYYKNDQKKVGVPLENDAQITTGMSQLEMQSESFVNILNNNIKNIEISALKKELVEKGLIDDSYNLELVNWKQSSNGYPTLEGVGTN